MEDKLTFEETVYHTPDDLLTLELSIRTVLQRLQPWPKRGDHRNFGGYLLDEYLTDERLVLLAHLERLLHSHKQWTLLEVQRRKRLNQVSYNIYQCAAKVIAQALRKPEEWDDAERVKEVAVSKARYHARNKYGLHDLPDGMTARIKAAVDEEVTAGKLKKRKA